MSVESAQPDPAGVLELLEGFRRSKTMFAGVSLGVFDALVGKPQTAAELAKGLGLHLDAGERLLDGLVGLGLLVRSGERYENTPAATAYLTSSSPQRFTGYIRYSNDVLWKLWADLEGAVREGTHRWKAVYGWDGPIFKSFFSSEEAMREFLMGMHGFGVLSSPHVARAFDLGAFRTIADLGGATGHLAIACCKAWPELRGIVFDLPEATGLAKEIVGESRVAARVQVLGGDFFVDELPQADLYALGRILHDWSEEKIHRLLKRIYDALPSGGALLVAEKLLHDDKSGPRWAHLQSLNMLVCTEGKERTAAEYSALLKAAGFSSVESRTTPMPIDALLARKA